MSPLAAPLATLLFFSGFAAAQIFAPDCSLTWKWSFNSLDQNACTVAAYLMSTCNGGSFTVNALVPGYSYNGPLAGTIDASNMCKCNTVTYSLISACDACQGSQWISWSEFTYNCTSTLPPSSFPNPIPSGTRVPKWALIDITSGNNWDANKSFTVGDTPEQVPGVLLGPSGAATVSVSGTRSGATSSLFDGPSSTVGPTSASAPTSKSSSNTGAIVGGAVGGVVIIALAAIVIVYFMRRRRPEAPAPVAPPAFSASQPPMDEIQQPLTMNEPYAASIPGTIGSSIPGTPGASMRIYDPNDSSTFPGYQGVPQTPSSPLQGNVQSFPGYQGVPQTPSSPPHGGVQSFQGVSQMPTSPAEGGQPSFNGTGNSLATMQTSRVQGYHGLPTV